MVWRDELANASFALRIADRVQARPIP